MADGRPIPPPVLPSRFCSRAEVHEAHTHWGTQCPGLSRALTACVTDGHRYDVIVGYDGDPTQVICTREDCGEVWQVESKK